MNTLEAYKTSIVEPLKCKRLTLREATKACLQHDPDNSEQKTYSLQLCIPYINNGYTIILDAMKSLKKDYVFEGSITQIKLYKDANRPHNTHLTMRATCSLEVLGGLFTKIGKFYFMRGSPLDTEAVSWVQEEHNKKDYVKSARSTIDQK